MDTHKSFPSGNSHTHNTTYLHQRIQSIGLLPEDLSAIDPENGNSIPLLAADEHGNIVIQYLDLRGKPLHYKDPDGQVKWPIPYTRTRLRYPAEDGRKYTQRKGSPQWPYHNKGVIEKFKAATPIDTLILVEGEFKALAGWLAGLDIIGIPSIHGFYNGDVRGKLHEDIQEVLVRCQVKKVVFLVDADLLTLKWEPKKDLGKRPESFFAAVKLFRESLQPLLDQAGNTLEGIYLMHGQTKYANEAKGLDDMLATFPAAKEEIVHNLLQFQFAGKWFTGRSILDANKDLQKLREYLGLTTPEAFYKTYGEFIDQREFLFKGKRYEYNPEKKEVQFVRHEDADKYMRIGADWFKVIRKIDKSGMEYEELKVWPIGEIQRDYKMGRNADFFIEQLMRYDDFINEPSWNGTYQRVLRNCYNLCYPFRWEKKEGPICETVKFLKHVFGGQATPEQNIEGDPFTIALDWLTIFHRDPKQPLPVIVLVSRENETGKSTFMKWLRNLYGPNNAVILSNEEFKMKFNAHYVSKALIMVDEGFLDAEKKSEKERLKKLVTSDTAYIEFKGADLKLINYYAKIIISSNDDDRVMKIEEEENRWFVIKVPRVAKKDPDLERKMEAEMPAWVHFISTREVYHQRKSRLWFQSELIITDQFRKIVENTRNRIDRVFEDWMREQFRLYRLPYIKYGINQLVQVFNDMNTNKYKVDKIELRYYLERRGVQSEKKAQRFRTPTGVDWPDLNTAGSITTKENDPTFPYRFHIGDWLPQEEIDSLMPFSDPERWLIYPYSPDHKQPAEIKQRNDLPF